MLLVVDDNLAVLEVLERQLSRRWAVMTVTSGAECLGVLASGIPVDLVLTDYHMPGQDGLHLAKAIEDAGFEMPIVMISGHISAASAAAFEGEGLIVKVLSKPAPAAALYAAIMLAMSDASTNRNEPCNCPSAT